MTLSADELIKKYEAAKEADLHWNAKGREWMKDRWVNNLLSECNMEELGHLRMYLTERISRAARKSNE